MSILAWTLGLPTVATALAIGWVHWSTRPRGPVETHESVAQHERFKAALATPVGPDGHSGEGHRQRRAS
jgi:hypothetical protein